MWSVVEATSLALANCWTRGASSSVNGGRINRSVSSVGRDRGLTGRSLLVLFVLEQLVLDGVHEGFPTGLDDVVIDADGPPRVLAVSAFDDDARLGACAQRGIEDAHLVVHEFHLGD